MLYFHLYKDAKIPKKVDSQFFLFIKSKYRLSFQYAWRNQNGVLVFMLMLVPIGIFCTSNIPKNLFPEISRDESILEIDWNEPIDFEENERRVIKFLHACQNTTSSESEVGYQQFVFDNNSNGAQDAEIYIINKYKSPELKKSGDSFTYHYFKTKFPFANIKMSNAPNAFEQLFVSEQPFFQVKLRFNDGSDKLAIESLDNLYTRLSEVTPLEFWYGAGYHKESAVLLNIDHRCLQYYSVASEDLLNRIADHFSLSDVTEVRHFGEVTPILLKADSKGLDFSALTVTNDDGTDFPVSSFVKLTFVEEQKAVAADEAGVYYSLNTNETRNTEVISATAAEHLRSNSILFDFEGNFFDRNAKFKELLVILAVSLLLMFIILAAEFESLTKPFLVLVSVPIGLSAAVLLLSISGNSINLMSGIGLVVVLGILDNDIILKIDRIEKLKRTKPLEIAIREAGMDRLKPIVMNTLTNILAILPIAFTSGLGADLQKPVVLTIAAGLLMATIIALYFVPILYYKIYNNEKCNFQLSDS